MTQLTVVAKITAKSGQEAQTRQALLDLIPTTQAEEGFIQYDLHTSNEEPGVFLLYENWASHDLWQQHMNNAPLKAFVAQADTLLAKPIELSLWSLV